ncbi:MAG TPA: glycosyltransferase family 1 protein [Terriglobales bacterium]
MSQAPPHVGLIALDRWRGGVIYTHNLVRALSRLPADERPRITLFCRNNDELFKEVSALADKTVVYNSLLDRMFYGTRYEVDAQRINAGFGSAFLGEAAPELARVAKREKVDAVFPVTVNYTRQLPSAIAWIPDLQHCFLPEFFSRLARAARDKAFPALLRDPNRHVVFSSRSAVDDALRAYGPPLAKTHVLHFTTIPLPEWFQDPAPIVAKYDLPPSYIILCNQFWIHKDHLTAFKAAAKLKSQGMRVDLVCTGPTQDNRHPEFFPRLKAQIKELGIERQVHILGMIPRVDQICLIRAAKAVLQPSQFEGWSTVIEDARSVGRPVIASDFPVHLEQNSPGSTFFHMGDADDCARAMASFLAQEQEVSYSTTMHEARILDFARDFMGIVNAALKRPSAGVRDEHRQASPSPK